MQNDAFIDDITAVFNKHPEAAERYGLANLELERRLGIDFDRQYGYSRIEGDRIITEYRDQATSPMARHQLCILRVMVGNVVVCKSWIEAEE